MFFIEIECRRKLRVFYIITRMRYILYLAFLLVCGTLSAASFSFQKKIERGLEGDYIVTEKENNSSVLILRCLTPTTLVLEEISIPSSFFDSANFTSWREWIGQGAPGHSSWTLFEIDLEKSQVKESYSYSQRRWLDSDDSENFLTSLLKLPLQSLSSKERKKIGPIPPSGESDHRSDWNPPLIFEGKKCKKPQFEAWRAFWPEDESRLAGSQIDLYFDTQHPDFPFPLWLEAYNGHYAFKLPAIDSGRGLHSTFKGMVPHRPIEFTKPFQEKEKSLFFHVKSPVYYTSFTLFAIDITSPSNQSTPISFRLHKTDQKEIILFEVSKQELQDCLEKDHVYRWAITPDNVPDVYLETDETWKL